jgi:hypothetical protein
MKQREHRLAIVRTIADPIGAPGHIDVAEKIEIGAVEPLGALDPRRCSTIVMSGEHDRAHEVGVEHEKPCAARDGSLGSASGEGEMLARDRSDVGGEQCAALLLGVRARGFGSPLGSN